MERNFPAARALARDFLDTHRTRDELRQLVFFEHGATYYDEGRFADARDDFEELIAEYANLQINPGNERCRVDDAKFYVGVIQIISKEYADSRESFARLRADWPESNRAAMSLQFINRSLVHEELEDWEPVNGVGRRGTTDHSAIIEANCDELLAEQPESMVCAEALLDLINYYSKRAWWNRAARQDFDRKITETVERLIGLAPEERATWRAKIDLACAIWRNEPQRALTLVDEVIEEASRRQDNSLLIDAQYNYARLLNRMGQPADARAIWDDLLQHELSPLLEGEVHTEIGLTYETEGNYQFALDTFAPVANGAEYPESVRVIALYFQAESLSRLGRMAEAIQLLDDLIAQYPDSTTATGAALKRRQHLAQIPR